jgi:hypothetical protein
LGQSELPCDGAMLLYLQSKVLLLLQQSKRENNYNYNLLATIFQVPPASC